MKKVVLAYSGGLDTSVAVAWLREQYDVRGRHASRSTSAAARCARASRRGRCRPARRGPTSSTRASGSSRDFVWPHLQANALYQGAYPLATALARPLIAQLLVEVARREGADAVAHGCTGKGNDQVRFDVAVHALDPGLEVIAPMRVGMGLTRDQEIDYAIERGIEIPITKASPYSIDVNLWGRSCETGVLEDPWVTPPADAYEWTVAASAAPAPSRSRSSSRAGSRSRSTASGSPRSSSSTGSTTLGGAHGVGRIDHVEDRLVGIKSREIYEAPAATILHAAHRALEGLTLTKDTLRFNRLVAERAGPADLRRAVVQRPPPRPARLRRVVPARRRGRGPGPARPRLGGRDRAALAAVALRQGPRDVRQGRRVRPRGRGRVHRDLRPAAAGRGGSPRRRRARATARPGRGPTRSSRRCRRP